jgi:hypothetical protein
VLRPSLAATSTKRAPSLRAQPKLRFPRPFTTRLVSERPSGSKRSQSTGWVGLDTALPAAPSPAPAPASPG